MIWNGSVTDSGSTFRALCTRPGWNRLADLLTAWILCPGRHTLTRLWQVIAPEGRPRYEAYAGFWREGRWHGTALWRRWTTVLVKTCRIVRTDERDLMLVLDERYFTKLGARQPEQASSGTPSDPPG